MYRDRVDVGGERLSLSLLPGASSGTSLAALADHVKRFDSLANQRGNIGVTLTLPFHMAALCDEL